MADTQSRDRVSVTTSDSAVMIAINGVPHELTVETRVSLLDALGGRLGLAGTKKGCNEGACTVHVGGCRVASCPMLAAQAEGNCIDASAPKFGAALAPANAVYHATGRRVRRLPIRVDHLQ